MKQILKFLRQLSQHAEYGRYDLLCRELRAAIQSIETDPVEHCTCMRDGCEVHDKPAQHEVKQKKHDVWLLATVARVDSMMDYIRGQFATRDMAELFKAVRNLRDAAHSKATAVPSQGVLLTPEMAAYLAQYQLKGAPAGTIEALRAIAIAPPQQDQLTIAERLLLKNGPRTETSICVGCGNWTPFRHDEAHDHEPACPELAAYSAAYRKHYAMCEVLKELPSKGSPTFIGIDLAKGPDETVVGMAPSECCCSAFERDKECMQHGDAAPGVIAAREIREVLRSEGWSGDAQPYDSLSNRAVMWLAARCNERGDCTMRCFRCRQQLTHECYNQDCDVSTAERLRREQLAGDAAYYEWRLEEILPLFEEARDALPAITLATARLHRVDLSLGERMDRAGTRTREDFKAAQQQSQQGQSAAAPDRAPQEDAVDRIWKWGKTNGYLDDTSRHVGTPDTIEDLLYAMMHRLNGGWNFRSMDDAPKNGRSILIWKKGWTDPTVARWKEEASFGNGVVKPGWQIRICDEDEWHSAAEEAPDLWHPLPVSIGSRGAEQGSPVHTNELNPDDHKNVWTRKGSNPDAPPIRFRQPPPPNPPPPSTGDRVPMEALDLPQFMREGMFKELTREVLYAALRKLTDRIEACGASRELTRAVMLSSAIAGAIGNRHNPPREYDVKCVFDAVTGDEVQTQPSSPTGEKS